MVIVTFGQMCLIKCNYFVYKDAQMLSDYGDRKENVFCLD